MDLSNPFNDAEIASGYEDWYQTAGKLADQCEKSLIRELLRYFPNAQTILEIGCGSGHFTRWFKKLGMQTVGIDLSFPMLYEARNMGALDFIQGDALKLPFLSRSFNVVALITSLEFISDPYQSLKEAFRIAQKGIILGVINRNSILGWQYRRTGGLIWDSATFFTPKELKEMLQNLTAGNKKVAYRTTLFPLYPNDLPLPWGGFIGMVGVCLSKEGAGDDG